MRGWLVAWMSSAMPIGPIGLIRSDLLQITNQQPTTNNEQPTSMDNGCKPAMLKSPVGTLTFLMTDIEGSTRMWETHPDAMSKAVIRSEQIIHEIVTLHDGYHVVEQGEGDSTLSVFRNATAAAQAARAIRDR